MDKKTIGKKLNNQEVEAIIRRYVAELKKEIEISDVFLYGSYAKDKANENSDIDICVISPQFGADDVEDGQYLLKKTIRIDTRLEPVGYSPGIYQREESSLIYEIKKHGRAIKV